MKHVSMSITKKVLLLVLLTGFGFFSETNAQKKELFNGTSLDGWIVYGTEKWYAKDGLLICESGPDKEYGYLATEKHYKNFILDLDFKQDADGNSGVFIRSKVDGSKIREWQVEVAPKKMKTTGGIYESYGRGWLIKPDSAKAKYHKEGEWNHMRIKAYGDKLTSWLNGKKMVSIEDEEIGKGEGSIALQIHRGGDVKIEWKNIVIKELKD